MPWIKELTPPKPHKCRLPWILWHRVGSVWECPKCARLYCVVRYDGIKDWELIERVTVNGQDQIRKAVQPDA